MTDLKTLLDEAAGPDPVVTDTELSADLQRGRRAARRRRTAGAGTVAVATAVAIGTGYLLAPTPAVNGGTDAPAASVTGSPSVRPTDQPSVRKPRQRVSDPGMPVEPSLPPLVWADKPVALVPNTKVPRGATITCDLMPKGWEFGVRPVRLSGQTRQPNSIYVRDPKSTYPSVEPPGFSLDWDRADGNAVSWGSFGDKVGNGWAAQVSGVVDGKQFAMFTDRGNTLEGRPGEVFVRLSRNVTIQAGIGPRTGWDSRTAARWAASCHPVR